MAYLIRLNKNILLIFSILFVTTVLKSPAQHHTFKIPVQEEKLVDSLLKNLKTSSWNDTLVIFNHFATKNLDKNDGAIAVAGQKLKIYPERHCFNATLSKSWLMMSKALLNLGYKVEAAKYVDRAIHCPVDYSTSFLLDAIGQKALIETYLGKSKYALKLAEMVVRSHEATISSKLNAFTAKSIAWYDLQDYQQSLKAIEEAVKYLQKDSSDISVYVSIHVQAGLVNYVLGKLPEALRYYLKAKRIAEKQNAYDLLFTVYNNIGTVLWQAGDPKAALSFFEKALSCHKQMKYPQQVNINIVYNNLGLINNELGNKTEAENYLIQSIQGYTHSNDSVGMTYPLNNLANICLRQHRIDEGLQYIDLAIQILERKNRLSESIPVLHTKAQLLLEKKSYQESDALIDRAISYAQKLSLQQEMVYLYEEKARIAEMRGDYKKALDFYKKFKEYENKYSQYLTEVKLVQAKAEAMAEKDLKEVLAKEPEKPYNYGVSRAWAFVALLSGLLLISLIILFNQYLHTRRARHEIQQLLEEMAMLKKSLAENMKKASESDQLKNHILTTMYHELRTPLNGINGFAELLIEECAIEKHRQMARSILQSGERLLNTLNGILELSDTELLKLDVRLSNFNVHQVIDKLVREKYRDLAEEKGLEFYYQPRKTQIILRSDEEMFKRILDLLVDNAVKFTSRGSITIEIVEEFKDNRPMVHVRVKDTGIGIPYEMQGLIFASFRQASEGHQRSHDGTGIGLSLAKNLVNILGGNISVESQPGQGSTFTISFPALTQEEQQNDSHFRAFASAGVKTHRILVVEDDDTNREFMLYNLQNLYHTDVALDGSSALQKAQTHHYDAILLDISLGKGITGIDVIKELRKDPDTRLTPVAAITANVRLYKPEDMIEVGFTHYLAKPFTRSELAALIKTMLGQATET